VASSCEANLGSKLSEGTDNIGNNAIEIYPKIHNGAWRRADDSVAVLVGRNYYGVKGAEIEGKIVCLGDFEIQVGGPADLVEVGVGSRVVPNDGDVILVGKDLKIKKKVRVMELGGKGVGNIVYGGNYNSNQGTIDTFGTVTNNPNLDLTYFVSALDDLRKKSAYWASLPPNGNSASYQWGWQFSKGNNECVQVMNVEASKLGGGNWVNFHSSLSGKTIVINVVDTGAVTINQVQDMVDPSGNRAHAFSPAVTKNILWNFPHATSVTLNGGAEFQGSILVPNGDLIFKHPGHSGRVIVAGDLTQNYGGSEFHNYQFDPNCPLPLPECDDLTTAPTKAPTTMAQTKSPTKAPAPMPSGSQGDPHFKTWMNEHYEYHGQCDLVLAKDPNFADGLGMDVQIRTKLVRFWSYIKNAAVRIGEDILEVEGSYEEQGRYWINWEYHGELETLGGFPVTMIGRDGAAKRKYEIDLSSKYPGQKIVVSTYKEFVRIEFENGTEESFGNTVGLLGDFNTGKTLARDGTTVLNDFVELGNEWQVLPSEDMLFHCISAPQFPQQCVEPEDPRGARRRRLDESAIVEADAEKACAHLKSELDRKDCVYDVLATQDLDMVGVY